MRKYLAVAILLCASVAWASTLNANLLSADLSAGMNITVPLNRPDCESIGYVHAWEYPTTIMTTLLYCPDDPGCNDPAPTRVCLNCGKRQVKPKPTKHAWEDVK